MSIFTVVVYTAKAKKLKVLKRLTKEDAVNSVCDMHKQDAVVVLKDGMREPFFRNRVATQLALDAVM